jgi:hypothetical protein
MTAVKKRTHNISIANMAADGTNSAFALSFSVCSSLSTLIRLLIIYLTFVTGIKLGSW